MSVYKPKNSPYYQYDFVWKGARFHGSTGCTSKRDAQEVERRERQKAVLPSLTRPPVTLDEAAGMYSLHAENLNSWPTIKYLIADLIAGLGANRLLSEIRQRDLQVHFAKRRAGRSNATVNREIENARAIWRRAEKAKFDIGDMPSWSDLMLKVDELPPRELAFAEEDKLLPAIADDVRDFVAFALESGWRRAEVIGLRWSDVDQINRQAKTRIKGGRTIRRPLTAKLTALIFNQPKVGPFIFTYLCRQSRGKRKAGERYPLTASLVRDRFAEAKEAAGIEDFRFHDLRHTRGTRIVRQTGSIAHASKALAHTNLKTTMRYAHVLDDDVRWALEASESRTIPEANAEKARKA